MKEFLDTLFHTTKDRIKNPLIGAFSIAWIIFNWQSIMIFFFSNSSIEKKIEIVKPKNGIKEPNFWIPLLIAIAYLIVLPYVMVVIDFLTNDSFSRRKRWASDRRVKELDESKRVVEKEVELEKLRTEFKDVAQLNSRNDELKLQVDDLLEQNESLSSDIVELRNENSALKVTHSQSEREPLNIEKNKEAKIKFEELDEKEKARLKRRFGIKLRNDLRKNINSFTDKFMESTPKDLDELSHMLLIQLDTMKLDIENKIATLEFDKKGDISTNILDELHRMEDEVIRFAKYYKNKNPRGWQPINEVLQDYYRPIFDLVDKTFTN